MQAATMSENMTESGVKSALPPASLNTESLLGLETVQKPSLEIVEVSETWRDDSPDDRQCANVGTDINSTEGMRSQDRDRKKENRRRASTGKSLWSKIVKGFQTASISKPSIIVGTAREELEQTKKKRSRWVQVLRNLFRPRSKKPNHHKSSEMSTLSVNYHVLGSEEALPFLEYTHFQKGDAVGSSHSGSANSDQLAYNPLTSSNLPPPWILRKWKLRDSQKLLRIDPAEELLFHLTDDTSQQYTCSIKLENKAKRYVAFKFKCTSPENYLMRPKHGVLAPSTTIEVKGLKIGDPFSASASKNDMFVVVTLPIPASLMKEKLSTVSSSIFERFPDQCCCEAVFHAVFRSPSSASNAFNIDRQVGIDAFLGNQKLRLASIPEHSMRL